MVLMCGTLTMKGLLLVYQKSAFSGKRGGNMILPSSVVQKIDEVRTSLINVNQELMLVGHSAGIEGAIYRLSQIINVNVGMLSTLIEDSRPQNESIIIRDDFGIFEHLLPAELIEYKRIEDEKHKVFCTWRLLESKKWEILRSVKNRLTGRAE